MFSVVKFPFNDPYSNKIIEKPAERNVAESIYAIERAKIELKFDNKNKAKKELETVGLIGISAFWSLKAFSKSFYSDSEV